MNSKFGMFSVLVLGIMMLLIPATSMANAQQEYEDKYYEDETYKKVDKKSYNEPYKKEDERKSYYNVDKEKSEEPVIIIKNEPIQKKEKKKEMKEPPMLLVKKDILYCDDIANNKDFTCFFDEDQLPGPESDRYVQECEDDIFEGLCDIANEVNFDMIVTDNIEFPGSEDGKKLTFNGERYTVSEETNIGFEEQIPILDSICQEAGFDSGFAITDLNFPDLVFCTVFEGKCSGFVQDGELKECTVKNYLVELGVG